MEHLRTINIDDALNLAIQHFQAGNVNASQYICKEIIKNQPDNSAARRLIEVLNDSSDKTVIFDIVGYARKLKNICLTHIEIGDKFLDKEDYKKAVERYESAISINSGLPDLSAKASSTYLKYGNRLIKEGRFEEAANCGKRASSLTPDNPETFILYARGLKEIGKLEDAAKMLRHALTLNPEEKYARILLRKVLYQITKDQGVININTASVEQMMNALGIDRDTARKITEFRPFGRKDVLKRKRILPDDEYERISDIIVAGKNDKDE